jgi:hypothetical protein
MERGGRGIILVGHFLCTPEQNHVAGCWTMNEDIECALAYLDFLTNTVYQQYYINFVLIHFKCQHMDLAI